MTKPKWGPIVLAALRDMLIEGGLPLGRTFSDVDAMDISERLGVPIMTVTNALNSLKRQGIVDTQDMGSDFPPTWQIVDTLAADGIYSW